VTLSTGYIVTPAGNKQLSLWTTQIHSYSFRKEISTTMCCSEKCKLFNINFFLVSHMMYKTLCTYTMHYYTILYC